MRSTRRTRNPAGAPFLPNASRWVQYMMNPLMQKNRSTPIPPECVHAGRVQSPACLRRNTPVWRSTTRHAAIPRRHWIDSYDLGAGMGSLGSFAIGRATLLSRRAPWQGHSPRA